VSFAAGKQLSDNENAKELLKKGLDQYPAIAAIRI